MHQFDSHHKKMIEGVALFNYKLKCDFSSITFTKKTKLISMPDRKFFLITFQDDICIWDLEAKRVLHRYRHTKKINGIVSIDASVDEDPYGDITIINKKNKTSYYLAFSDETSVNILSFNTGKIVKKLILADNPEYIIKKVDLVYLNLDRENPNKRRHYIMVVGNDKCIRIWDWQRGKVVKTINCEVKFDGPTAI
mmetsp:Transcript_39023/g.34703  ORF Transcript_39023/g.34703 Transcript_39023/m.34703 type:complete len:195 (+) Transcript_39023:1363-1947(+)